MIRVSRDYAAWEALKGDEERGRASGIPECCIAFFTEFWAPFIDELIANGKEGPPTDMYSLESQKAGFGYVPCPRCLKTLNKVDIIMHFPNTGRPLMIVDGKAVWSPKTFGEMTDEEIVKWDETLQTYDGPVELDDDMIQD